jgi:hypothetical protein
VSVRRNHCYVYGFIASVIVSFILGTRSVNKRPNYSEIDPDFRRDVVKMFADFKAGRVRDHVKIEILDGITLDVGIVAIVREGEFGFVTSDNPLGTYFYIEQEGFRVQRFNERK